MSPKDNLHRIIDQLPDDKAEALERLAVQMLREDPSWGQTRPGLSFDEALAATNRDFGESLKRLGQ